MNPTLPLFLDRIVGARSDDPTLARQELIVNATALGLGVLWILWLTVDLLTRVGRNELATSYWEIVPSYVGMGIASALCLAAYGLARRGQIQAAAYLLVALLLGYTAWLTWRWGIEITEVVLYLLSITMASPLLGAKGGLLTATAALLLYTGVGLLQIQSIHPVPLERLLLPNVLSFGLVLYLAAFVNWIVHEHLDIAWQETQQQAAELSVAQEIQDQLLADLQAKTEEQARLLHTVEELSAPIAVVHDQIIVLPLKGYLDKQRADQVRQALLQGISRHRAKIALVDITGLPLMNKEIVHHLETMSQAGRLLGAEVVLVGVQAEAAAEIIKVGANLHNLHTRRDLQSGIEWALAGMGQSRVGND
jgi:anti-anti-sigma regulatory factor